MQVVGDHLVPAGASEHLYRKAFPRGLADLTAGRRDERTRKAQALATVLAGMPGLEACGKAVGDAAAAVEAARVACRTARLARMGKTVAKQDARQAVVLEFKVARGTALSRLRDPKAVDEVFPDLSGPGGNGSAQDHVPKEPGTEASEAPAQKLTTQATETSTAKFPGPTPVAA